MNELQRKQIVDLIDHARCNPDDSSAGAIATEIEDILTTRLVITNDSDETVYLERGEEIEEERIYKVFTGKAKEIFPHISAIAARFPDRLIKLWVKQGGR